ncbi:ferrous iron transport protein B [Pedobacter yulinensis]|uniref:Ferrous iron transport protein B n=1 Tax=Pedobacter yulinensis TaxID=2126353 RepID=A0A2T3HQB9_9SPHI|nr:ferrous iron transport protein B [Pedobacter yulinensis]PST84654.1 ferrous iron transport protein B [Pedobacter yulinensis]
MKKSLKVALVGNPNTGKSTLFNLLTGMNQKVGNFPGVTVDKKTGSIRFDDGRVAEVMDLPGTYSLYPKSLDEHIVFDTLAASGGPDVIVVIADATNLKRNLLLFTQVADLGFPVILALNMIDMADRAGMRINTDRLADMLGVQVVPISARRNKGIEELKKAIQHCTPVATQKTVLKAEEFMCMPAVARVKALVGAENDYYALQLLHREDQVSFLEKQHVEGLRTIIREEKFESGSLQTAETINRYRFINHVLSATVENKPSHDQFAFTNKVDRILTHRVWGFLIFIGILFFIFNAIFAWSSTPMDLIEGSFGWLSEAGHTYLPPGMLTDLLIDGVLAGLGGILVFIPQIAILFAFISVLEDSGYMSRVTFMMDKLMRKVGLNGKSVVPMIGGLACAVPSIMAARNIENWKDRMITIMVTPLVSCSARLPVYTLLISLVVPEQRYFGFFNSQGLALMLLYLASIVAAVLVAWVMKMLIRVRERSYLIMELPVYRAPRWRNVLLTMYEKSKTFVLEAGKVIVAISIVLWVLASFGPGNRFDRITSKYETQLARPGADSTHIQTLMATEKLENSYVGILGHAIEPVIRPLGYDWKIGIALITSFAAREAFVGTMATIYSVDGGEDDSATLGSRMAASKNSVTGLPVYTFATGVSLMLFYAFAMQCMSTFAVVYRETKGWKWPVIQLLYMTALAYAAALVAYQLLK